MRGFSRMKHREMGLGTGTEPLEAQWGTGLLCALPAGVLQAGEVFLGCDMHSTNACQVVGMNRVS